MAEKTVLFVCVENACRSLMAEAMFNAQPLPGWRAISAGTAPTSRPNPRTEGMLRELGLDPPAHAPQLLTEAMMAEAAVVVTMGCLDSTSCPARLKALHVRDWGLPDPARLDDTGFRQVRQELRSLVEDLRRELATSGASRAAVVPRR